MTHKTGFKAFFQAYGSLFKILISLAPGLLLVTFLLSLLSGFIYPLTLRVNEGLFDEGLKVAAGDKTFQDYSLILVALVLVTVMPNFINIFIFGMVEKRSQLILKTVYKGKMLKKLKKIKYEHFEDPASIEIMDKAFTRTENAVRHLFPMYILNSVSSAVSLTGLLVLLFHTKWWLVLTSILPLIVETKLLSKDNYSIYDELEKYYRDERKYTKLGDYLRSRNHIRELKLFDAGPFILDKYKTRIKQRNGKYESYYLGNLKRFFLRSNVSRFFAIVNAVLVLMVFLNKEISIGRFIAVSSMMFGPLQETFTGAFFIFKASAYHMKFFEYYHKFFDLSEENNQAPSVELTDMTLEFDKVWFKYPNTDTYILKGLSFTLHEGEKLSLVGENGEGKSTIIKLLLGLFEPTQGSIRIGGLAIGDLDRRTLSSIFAPIFQDFNKYAISLKENITIGSPEPVGDPNFNQVVRQAKVFDFMNDLPNGKETLLGRDFKGGIDLSGGQWQRIAIARALVGHKKIMLLDEPTSQLDPMAESDLYQEFNKLVHKKSAIFITHRLASTVITDRILVIHKGVVFEEGNHETLMVLDGLYAQMFKSQKQWYQKEVALENVR